MNAKICVERCEVQAKTTGDYLTIIISYRTSRISMINRLFSVWVVVTYQLINLRYLCASYESV